jgi:TonB family protein
MRSFAVFAAAAALCAAPDDRADPHKPPQSIPPSVVSKIQPEYSEEGVRQKIEGMVLLFLVVDEHGNPGNIEIISPLGYGLDEKAVEAVQQWKFKPGMKNGMQNLSRLFSSGSFRLGSRMGCA